MNPRVITAVVAVLAGHAILLAVALLTRNTPPTVPVETRTLSVELLSPAPVAAPVALSPTPAPPKPEPKIKPKAVPRPVHAVKPAPKPLPVSTEPAPNAITAPEPAPPAPPAPAAPAAAAPGPSAGHPSMISSVPKSVANLDCSISEPPYPPLSRRRGETGSAIVSFVINQTGKIQSVKLAKSSGFSRLDDAALAVVRNGTCRPYVENGTPIVAAGVQPFNFNLQD